MEVERWKPIEGYEGIYEISDYGRIRSLDRIIECRCDFGIYHSRRKGTYLRFGTNQSGYYNCRLYKDTFGKTQLVSRLVAQTFIPNPNNYPEVNHKDGNKKNNYYKNLEWMTHNENYQHGLDTGLINNVGENASKAILSDEDVIKILQSQKSARELSKKFKVNKSVIYQIKNKVTWKHIKIDVVKIPRSWDVERHKGSKLTEKQVINIIKSKKLTSDLAKEYKISKNVICNIRAGRTWKYIKLERNYKYKPISKSSISKEKRKEIQNSKLNFKDICKKFSISQTTYYRIKREEKQ